MECKACDFKCEKQSIYDRHFNSEKHKLVYEIFTLKNQIPEKDKKSQTQLEEANLENENLKLEIVKALLDKDRAIQREEQANLEKEIERTKKYNLQKGHKSIKYGTLCEQEKLLFNQQSEKSNFEREQDKIEYSKKLEEYEEKMRLKDLENKRLRERSSYNSISLSSVNKTSTSNISTTFDMKNISEVDKIEDMNTSDTTVRKLAKDINSSTNTVNFGGEDSSHQELEKSDERIPIELDIKENKSKYMHNFRYT
jgi:hypothetical protein